MPLSYKRSGNSQFFGKKNARDRAVELIGLIEPLRNAAKNNTLLQPLLDDLLIEHENMVYESRPLIDDEDMALIKLYLETESLAAVVELIKKTPQEASRRVLRVTSILSDFGESIGIKLPKGRVGTRACADILETKTIIFDLISQHNNSI